MVLSRSGWERCRCCWGCAGLSNTKRRLHHLYRANKGSARPSTKYLPYSNRLYDHCNRHEVRPTEVCAQGVGEYRSRYQVQPNR